MSARHSPGPWRAGFHRQVLSGQDIGSRVICEVWSGSVDSIAQADANQALIASAPNLLRLAKRYASECAECGGTGRREKPMNHRTGPDPGFEDCPDCADIRSVIEEAEGTA